jgi:hypothetical protein
MIPPQDVGDAGNILLALMAVYCGCVAWRNYRRVQNLAFLLFTSSLVCLAGLRISLVFFDIPADLRPWTLLPFWLLFTAGWFFLDKLLRRYIK